MSFLKLSFVFFLLIVPVIGKSQQKYFTAEEVNWISKHPKIEFGYKSDWPPYEIFENHEYSGIVAEYLKIISRETGIVFVPIPLNSWSETVEKLHKGEIKFVPACGVTDDRKKFLEFTSPIISETTVIVTRRKDDYANDLSFLNNHNVAVLKGHYPTEIISKAYPLYKIIEYDDMNESLHALADGDVDAFFGNLGVVSFYTNNHGFKNLKIEAPGEFDAVDIAMASTKDWIQLRNVIQKVLDRITIEEKNRIRKKWITVQFEYGISRKQFMTYVYIGLGIILTISMLFYMWYRSLKKEIQKRSAIQMSLEHSLIELKKYSNLIEKRDAEKRTMLQEIHHRVKNNLQIVSSLLKLQAYNSEENNLPFDHSQTISRIAAISLIHEMIYKSNELDRLNLKEYVKSLLLEVIQGHADGKEIKLDVHIENLVLNINTLVPLAVIVNELALNSIRHSFKGKDSGEIRIKIKFVNDKFLMEYNDDGDWSGDINENSFGFSLINIFTEQLDGKFILNATIGTHYSFEFTLQKEDEKSKFSKH